MMDYFNLVSFVLAWVAVVSIAIAVLIFRSYRRGNEGKLVLLCAAFGLFSIKSILTVLGLVYALLPPVLLVAMGGIFDLVIVVLFFIPFFKK